MVFALLGGLQNRMANTKSAIKRIKQTGTRTSINRNNKTRLRNQLKKLRGAISQGDAAAAQQLLAPTFSIVDRAVQKGVIKKNNASRVKSRLAVRVNALRTPESAPADAK